MNKVRVTICCEDGESYTSNVANMSSAEMKYFDKSLKDFERLQYLAIQVKGDMMYFNPTKILWVSTRVVE